MKNSQPVSLIGAGGHSRSLIPLVKHLGIHLNGVYDESYSGKQEEIYPGVFLIGKTGDFPEGSPAIIAIGNNEKRSFWFNKLKVLADNLIHPQSFQEKYVQLGNANQIFANSYINFGARIGNNNIINSGALVEHEVQIGNHNHISIGAKIAGRAKISDCCMIGASATILDKIEIASNVIIGAGSVVHKSIFEPGTYVGVPARRIK